MKVLAEIGIKIRVTPNDEIWIHHPSGTDYLDDKTPFVMLSEGRLEDGHMFYGIYGRVIDGPERYHGLICNLLARLDGDDWRVKQTSQANFKVGPKPAYRNHKYEVGHPEGTIVDGYPVIGRYGHIEVIES